MTQSMGTVESTSLQESVSRRDIEASTFSLRARLIELESEHLRLQRLVAELLIKNQKLRELLCEQLGRPPLRRISVGATGRCNTDTPRRTDLAVAQ